MRMPKCSSSCLAYLAPMTRSRLSSASPPLLDPDQQRISPMPGWYVTSSAPRCSLCTYSCSASPTAGRRLHRSGP